MTNNKELDAKILRYHFVERWGVNTIAVQLGIHHTTVDRVLCQAVERARKESLRRAGALYRLTPWGRHNNAARQGRFRARQKEKVTHQGSLPILALGLLLLAVNAQESALQRDRDTTKTAIYCHVCQRECAPFLRNRFLRPSERVPPRPIT